MEKKKKKTYEKVKEYTKIRRKYRKKIA